MTRLPSSCSILPEKVDFSSGKKKETMIEKEEKKGLSIWWLYGNREPYEGCI